MAFSDEAEKDSLFFCAYTGPLYMIQDGLPMSRSLSLITSIKSLCHVLGRIQGYSAHHSWFVHSHAPSNNTSLGRCPPKRGLLHLQACRPPGNFQSLLSLSQHPRSMCVKRRFFLPSSLLLLMLGFCLNLYIAPSSPKNASPKHLLKCIS